eukprot:1492000-Ditylum_brightwellii.AAC.1
MDNFIDNTIDQKVGGESICFGDHRNSFSKTNKSYQEVAKSAADKHNLVWVEIDINLAVVVACGGTLAGEAFWNLIVECWEQQFPVLIKRRKNTLGEKRLYLIVQLKYPDKKHLNLSME